MFFLRELPTRTMVEGVLGHLPEVRPDTVLSKLAMLREASLLLRRIESFLATHGLSQTQFLVLMVILREPDATALTPSAIAWRLDVSKPVLTKTLATMTQRGLIDRVEPASDARTTPLRVSADGRALFAAVLPGYFAILQNGAGREKGP